MTAAGVSRVLICTVTVDHAGSVFRQTMGVRNLALADVSEPDLRAMLAENETLFVEHKGALRDEGFQVAKAICSFANTLGGWVLIGVTTGHPNAGEPDGWEPVAAHEMTDRVRQALQANRVDPVPPFAATVLDYGEPGKPIGVVRVYESADTPHIAGNGQVFVRSVAEDSDAGRKYQPGGVETQAVLLSLAERGRAGILMARGKFDAEQVPLAARTAGIDGRTFSTSNEGRIGIRAVPLNGLRLTDWSVSRRAMPILDRAVRRLARRDDDIALDPSYYASGLTLSARSENLLEPQATVSRHGVASVTADAAGVVAACLQFGVSNPPLAKTKLTLNGFRDLLLTPLLEAVLSILTAAEAHGRVLLELRIGRLEQVITLDNGGGAKPIPAIPVGSEVTLPLDDEQGELIVAAEHWRSDVGRAAGYPTLRP